MNINDSPATRNRMWYQISNASDFLKAEMFGRETAEQTREFLNAVAAECLKQQCYRVLLSIRSSRPIFTVDKYGLSSFSELAVKYSGKIAVIADSIEIRVAQEYVVMLARLRGVNARTFRDEAAAARWLKNEPQ